MKILLDTTYILPILGLEVKETKHVLSLLSKLYHRGLIEIYYSSLSLLEAIAKISRRSYDEELVRIGLLSIEESFKRIEPGPEDYLLALRLRSKGFRDLVDLLLYSIARNNGLLFLTRDKSLATFLRETGEQIRHIILEDEFIKKYGYGSK